MPCSLLFGAGAASKPLQRGVHISHDLPALVNAELRGVRGHLVRTHCDYVEDPPRGELHETIGDIRWRWRDFPRDGPISFAVLSVADHAISLVESFAFFERLRCCKVGILQVASGASGFFFAGPVMESVITAWHGSGYRTLQREAITSHRIGSKGLVCRTARHVGHILVGALLRVGAASGQPSYHG